MTISKIREVIEAARWNRRDLAGATREEFMRENVAKRLSKHVEAISGLDIPSKFIVDKSRRDEEISYCNEVILKWTNLQRSTKAVN